MTKIKTRVFLSAMVLIMLAGLLITGGTYGLFTATNTVSNHLKAGNLNVSLERTTYYKKTVNSEGYLETYTYSSATDFTGAVNANIFGLEDNEVVVPGSQYGATLRLRNGKQVGSTYVTSSVAFKYDVKLVVSSDSDSELAKQIYIQYTEGDTTTTTAKKISEVDNDLIFSGTMTRNDSYHDFTIEIFFIDLDTNNAAQNKKVNFDLIIEAVQLTEKRD